MSEQNKEVMLDVTEDRGLLRDHETIQSLEHYYEAGEPLSSRQYQILIQAAIFKLQALTIEQVYAKQD